MLDQLTQNQQLGFIYQALIRNQANTASGYGRTDWTAEEVLHERMAAIGEDLFNQVIEAKNGRMKTSFLAASLQVQQQVQTLLEVDDIMKFENGQWVLNG